MQITAKKAVVMNYHLTDDHGKILDSSRGRKPLSYIQGMGNLIPGLEKELEGKAVGANLKVRIKPEEAYGVKEDRLVQKVPRNQFDAGEIKVGMQFEVNQGDEYRVVTVTEVTTAEVTIDGNHPLAGVPLNFEVEVIAVREASAEEIAHGHVHGEHGHQH
jgi:FKBP-type peptidyl-prolyl cis-trans isomerase SlyD